MKSACVSDQGHLRVGIEFIVSRDTERCVRRLTNCYFLTITTAFFDIRVPLSEAVYVREAIHKGETMKKLFHEQFVNLRGEIRRNRLWTGEVIEAACNQNALTLIAQFLLGHAEITIKKYFIDCDADPFTHRGYHVVERLSRKEGFVQFDASKDDELWPAMDRISPRADGHRLFKELQTKPVLTAHVLDYRLAHPDTIPKKWAGRHIFYWGTIYANDEYPDRLYVRYLCWDGTKNRWTDGMYCLDTFFGSFHYAALRAA
jgi:hypothetical protein